MIMLDVLDAIHDPDGRDLFNSIATERRSNNTFDHTVEISRKQYYHRLDTPFTITTITKTSLLDIRITE